MSINPSNSDRVDDNPANSSQGGNYFNNKKSSIISFFNKWNFRPIEQNNTATSSWLHRIVVSLKSDSKSELSSVIHQTISENREEFSADKITNTIANIKKEIEIQFQGRGERSEQKKIQDKAMAKLAKYFFQLPDSNLIHLNDFAIEDQKKLSKIIKSYFTEHIVQPLANNQNIWKVCTDLSKILNYSENLSMTDKVEMIEKLIPYNITFVFELIKAFNVDEEGRGNLAIKIALSNDSNCELIARSIKNLDLSNPEILYDIAKLIIKNISDQKLSSLFFFNIDNFSISNENQLRDLFSIIYSRNPAIFANAHKFNPALKGVNDPDLNSDRKQEILREAFGNDIIPFLKLRPDHYVFLANTLVFLNIIASDQGWIEKEKWLEIIFSLRSVDEYVNLVNYLARPSPTFEKLMSPEIKIQEEYNPQIKLIRLVFSQFPNIPSIHGFYKAKWRALIRKNPTPLINLLIQLNEINGLTADEKIIIIQKLQNSPEPKKFLDSLQIILSIEPRAALNENFVHVAQNLFENLIPLGQLKNDFKQSYETIFLSSRNPTAALTYAIRLASLESTEYLKLYGAFITSVLNGENHANRYSAEQNPHLTMLDKNNPETIKRWATSATKIVSGNFSVEDSDDPIDLLLCGTDISGSCQSVDEFVDNNKGLLSYLIDGKIRLLAVKDKSGRIVARSIIKLLWDGEKPVMFFEKIYPYLLPEGYKKLLYQIARNKSESMGVDLLINDGLVKYGKSLKSLGGPAPMEYEDAFGNNTGVGGNVRNGIYELENTHYM